MVTTILVGWLNNNRANQVNQFDFRSQVKLLFVYEGRKNDPFFAFLRRFKRNQRADHLVHLFCNCDFGLLGDLLNNNNNNWQVDDDTSDTKLLQRQFHSGKITWPFSSSPVAEVIFCARKKRVNLLRSAVKCQVYKLVKLSRLCHLITDWWRRGWHGWQGDEGDASDEDANGGNEGKWNERDWRWHVREINLSREFIRRCQVVAVTWYNWSVLLS